MAFRLSILDQSPVLADDTPAGAVASTIALAKAAERFGYARYWLAEHHAMRGLAGASPDVLLARLTAETTRIRLGSGGVMLPHHAALKTAEAFRMLEALAPGRIDLGIGRAPGGSNLVSAALGSRDVSTFPDDVRDTIDFLAGNLPAHHPFASISAMPTGPTMPDVWLLGSSEYGALLAAEMGLPYTFAHFIGGDAPELLRAYKTLFSPSRRRPKPQAMIAFAAIVAPTDAEAERLSLPVALWRMLALRGRPGPVPSLAQAEAYDWSPLERREVEATRRIIAGSPATVRARIENLIDRHDADEAMIVTILPDDASRVRSYELLADVFALRAVA